MSDLKTAAKKSDAVADTPGPGKDEHRPSVDDPIRDLNGNLVDVNNDVLEGDHRLDGDLLVAHADQLTPQDAADIERLLA